MYKIKQYSLSDLKIWNDFVAKSKNATFLFDRNYMDYHSDRFEDCSLMIYKEQCLLYIFPANKVGNVVYSHQGLTYGGLLMNSKSTVENVLEAFKCINDYYKECGIRKIIYKPIPYIYSSIPAQEDLYALYKLCSARLIGRSISSSIYQSNKIQFSESRKSGIRKARNNNIRVTLSNDYDLFWDILTSNLHKKYNVTPVHSLSEINLLQMRFPNNIKLYMAYSEDNVPLGGTVIFLTPNVCHTQYISANEIGKKMGVLDLLFDLLINEEFKSYPIFDFGQSTEQMGLILNEALIFQKEGFGGRGVCYDVYEYEL